MGLVFFVLFVRSEISCQNVNISMVGKDVPLGNVRKSYLVFFFAAGKKLSQVIKCWKNKFVGGG